jgi:hypothetical protein
MSFFISFVQNLIKNLEELLELQILFVEIAQRGLNRDFPRG